MSACSLRTNMCCGLISRIGLLLCTSCQLVCRRSRLPLMACSSATRQAAESVSQWVTRTSLTCSPRISAILSWWRLLNASASFCSYDFSFSSSSKPRSSEPLATDCSALSAYWCRLDTTHSSTRSASSNGHAFLCDRPQDGGCCWQPKAVGGNVMDLVLTFFHAGDVVIQ